MALAYRLSNAGVFLQKLYHTVCQLGLVLSQGPCLVQRKKYLHQKHLVLVLQWQSKAVHNAEAEGGGKKREREREEERGGEGRRERERVEE